MLETHFSSIFLLDENSIHAKKYTTRQYTTRQCTNVFFFATHFYLLCKFECFPEQWAINVIFCYDFNVQFSNILLFTL